MRENAQRENARETDVTTATTPSVAIGQQRL